MPANISASRRQQGKGYKMSIHNIRPAVRRARERIKSQRDLLENSERQTRIVLIDPVLRAIGWNISNPDTVRIELPLNGGFADYALLNPETGSLLIIIEAKKLGDDRLVPHLPQLAGYSEGEGSNARYSVITNGDNWHGYENRGGLMRAANVLAVSITGDSDDKCATELARLLSPPANAASRSIAARRPPETPARSGIATTKPLFGGGLWPVLWGNEANHNEAAPPVNENPPLA